jgi:hypothetical protein
MVAGDNEYKPADAGEVTSISWTGTHLINGDVTNLQPAESETICLEPSGTASISVPLADIVNARLDGFNRLTHLNPGRFMNALQAAMELKDTKQTMTQAMSFLIWGRKMLGKKVRLRKGLLRPFSAAMRLADAASAYLWYKFGVEPTARDVKQFVYEISQGKLKVKGSKPTIRKRGEVIRGFYSARPRRDDVLASMYPQLDGGTLSRTVRRKLDYYGNNFRLDIRPSGQTDWFACRKVQVTDEVKGCYFASLARDVEISGIDEFKNRWSWNCPTFRTLWELVPFSFLVDWLVDVGKYIERMEKRYAQQTFVNSLGPIWRWERTQNVFYMPKILSLRMKLSDPVTVGPVQWTVNQSVEGSFSFYKAWFSRTFYRAPAGQLPSIAIPDIGMPVKAYQITTGMALILQTFRSWR